jgi:hypothetical protein
MTKQQIIAVYALGQCARMVLGNTGLGDQTQRNNWLKAVGIADRMLSDFGYPGHTQVLALMEDHWR